MSLNLIVTQTPLVGEISTALQTHPEVQQSIAQTQAIAEHKHDREQVQKTDKKEGAKSVDPEGRNERGGQSLSQRRGQSHDKKPPQEEPKQSPWAGNIIDVKI